MKKQVAQSSNRAVKNTKTEKRGKSMQTFHPRHNHPGGPEVWCQDSKIQMGPTQWESAIDRQNAQYRLVEKHAR